MKLTGFLAVAAALLLNLSINAATPTANYEVVPLPKQIMPDRGKPFTINASTTIYAPKGDAKLQKNAQLLQGYINNITGLKLKITTKRPAKNGIILDASLRADNKEAYSLTVDQNLVTINGATPAANFYGVQTLRKSLPADAKATQVVLPAVKITDQPRFGYRGGHLDVVRHFFPADSVKKFIDMLALHNANTFHWHLTDDQGWRLESKKYPRLTEIGAVRNGTCIGHDFETSDSVPYGGFYTRQEIADIIKYAADRHINIIPEIDLPGHMIAALKAYPHLGCTGGPYEVWQRWGVSDDLLCAGNDSTLTFIDDILNELADLFPYEYIHVGGDECPKTRWEECPKCQARIAELGLTTDSHSSKEQKLQSYIMTHASKTLADRGRRMIGWDEIMEGGLTPGAVVMSWRGEEGGREAARQGHDAIMTPTNYCYFDYYQVLDRTGEPDAIGGYVPLDLVYSFNPVPADFTPEEASHILGAQANLWTEYIPYFHQVEYMELPRFAAMSEVQWVEPEQKDYRDFTHRLTRLMKHYDLQGHNYAKHIYNVYGKLENNPEKGAIIATFETADNAPIHYTLDGTTPTAESPLYTEPLEIRNTCRVKAIAIRPEGSSPVFADSVSFNKATSRAITLGHKPHSRYNGPASVLVDGRFGPDAFNTNSWLGFEGVPLVATIDFGTPTEISEVILRNNVNTPNWIFDARAITVEVSADGEIYTEVASEQLPVMSTHVEQIITHTLKFAPVTTRYVRITELTETSIPAFHGVGEGKPAFLFIDEIIIK